MYSLLIQGEQNMRFVLVALATLSLVVTAHAADFSGTWKMNPAKSHVPTDTSGNVTSSMTIKIEQPRPDTLILPMAASNTSYCRAAGFGVQTPSPCPLMQRH